MAKNKYTHYQVATDLEVTVSYSYREAFSLYQKADAPKTLYGIDGTSPIHYHVILKTN